MAKIKHLKREITIAILWTLLRMGFFIWLFIEMIKLIEIIGGLATFVIYLVVTDWLQKQTKPIDEILAKRIREQGTKKLNKAMKLKFGKNGEDFMKGFNTPLP